MRNCLLAAREESLGIHGWSAGNKSQFAMAAVYARVIFRQGFLCVSLRPCAFSAF